MLRSLNGDVKSQCIMIFTIKWWISDLSLLENVQSLYAFENFGIVCTCSNMAINIFSSWRLILRLQAHVLWYLLVNSREVWPKFNDIKRVRLYLKGKKMHIFRETLYEQIDVFKKSSGALWCIGSCLLLWIWDFRLNMYTNDVWNKQQTIMRNWVQFVETKL